MFPAGIGAAYGIVMEIDSSSTPDRITGKWLIGDKLRNFCAVAHNEFHLHHPQSEIGLSRAKTIGQCDFLGIDTVGVVSMWYEQEK